MSNPIQVQHKLSGLCAGMFTLLGLATVFTAAGTVSAESATQWTTAAADLIAQTNPPSNARAGTPGSAQRPRSVPQQPAPQKPVIVERQVAAADLARSRIVLRIQQIRNMYFARYRQEFRNQPELYDLYWKRLSSLDEFALSQISNETFAQHVANDLSAEPKQGVPGLSILLLQELMGSRSILPPTDPRHHAFKQIASVHIIYLRNMVDEATFLSQAGQPGLGAHRFAKMTRAEFQKDFSTSLVPHLIHSIAAPTGSSRVSSTPNIESRSSSAVVNPGSQQSTPPSMNSSGRTEPSPSLQRSSSPEGRFEPGPAASALPKPESQSTAKPSAAQPRRATVWGEAEPPEQHLLESGR